MPTIGGWCGDGLIETWPVFVESLIWIMLECYKIDIEATVIYFGTLCGEIESDMTKNRLQLWSDEKLDLEILLLLLG